MADCDIEYAIASFMDIEFEVLPVEHSGGRRVITHIYPFTDEHYNEDLGDMPLKWSVKGGFYGEDWRDRLNVAKRVWSRKGAGVFFEPTENVSYNVTLLDWSFNYDNKKLNCVEFTLNFVEASEDPYPSNRAGRRDAPDASQATEDFLTEIREIYRTIMRAVDDFNAIKRGLESGRLFLDTAARMLIGPGGFLRAISAIIAAQSSRNPEKNLDDTEIIYEAAIEGGAPVSFFRRASEVRSNAGPVVDAQVNMTALIGLAYYFERLVSSNPSFVELAEFRERAISLKRAVPQATNAIDTLITTIGRVAEPRCVKEGAPNSNALVASYELFGNISRASDILALSGGVSGARLPRLVHPCDTL